MRTPQYLTSNTGTGGGSSSSWASGLGAVGRFTFRVFFFFGHEFDLGMCSWEGRGNGGNCSDPLLEHTTPRKPAGKYLQRIGWFLLFLNVNTDKSGGLLCTGCGGSGSSDLRALHCAHQWTLLFQLILNGFLRACGGSRACFSHGIYSRAPKPGAFSQGSR